VESLSFNPGLIASKLGRYFFLRCCDEPEVHLGISCAVVDVDDVVLSSTDAKLHMSAQILVHKLEQH
jgi:hypothetical protein